MTKTKLTLAALVFMLPSLSFAGVSSAMIYTCNNAPTSEPRGGGWICYYQNMPVNINPPPVIL